MMNSRDKNRLLCAITAYSFAALEASLFLNTHPADKNALEYYNKYNTMLKSAREAYEATWGTPAEKESSDQCHMPPPAPSPWEYEANCYL